MLRFIDEARLTGSLHHANVVGTHQVGEDEIGPFIVLEYIEGASLDELVERSTARGEKVPVQVALRIALDALSGLEAVHTAHDHAGRRMNILHRDISLQNLLVGVDGVCRVADFGAAKSDVRKYSTDQRYLLGKLLYLPPEYLRRDETGPTLDIYSLGITLWQTLAGVELWQDQSEAQVVASIIEGRIPKVSEYASVPPELDALIAKATSTNLKQRFQSAQLMAEAIESLGRDVGLLAPHSEVARWAKRLVADELLARRQRIADARNRLSSTEVHHAETVAPPPAPNRRWIRILAFTGAGAVATLAALLASRERTQAPSSGAPAIIDSASPTPIEPSFSAAPPLDPPPVVVPELTAAPGGETPIKSPQPPSSRSSAPARATAPASVRRTPRPTGSVSAPDSIIEKNPYR